MADFDSFWRVIVLAVVQGLTEFLPISSSGHLVLAAALILPDSVESSEVVEVNIVLHLGTLGSVCVYYFRRLWTLFVGSRRLLWLLFAATLPAVMVGVPLKIFLEPLFASPLVTGLMLIVTGGILLLTQERETAQTKTEEELSLWQALLIGVAQAVAVLPGLSRSGLTICTGLRLGLSPRSAATFSFLMAVPVIAGAGLLQAVSKYRDDATVGNSPIVLACGLVVSFAVGLGALSWLVGWLEKGRLSYFAYWCIPVGILVIAGWMAGYF